MLDTEGWRGSDCDSANEFSSYELNSDSILFFLISEEFSPGDVLRMYVVREKRNLLEFTHIYWKLYMWIISKNMYSNYCNVSIKIDAKNFKINK